MDEELFEKLVNTYEFMRPGKTLEEQKAEGLINDLYGAFHICTGNGWYSILNNWAREISEVYEKANIPCDVKIAQIKEKFGKLRIYLDFVGQEKHIHAFDFIGNGSIRFVSKDTPIHRKVAEITKKYEELSVTVCSECGNDGELRKALPWMLTLCDECYLKRIKREIGD